ncbi:MAG: hypothetical protein CFE24_14280 [Flavobacterium sp. BFFFF2]|nr:MAG: hypothetical protein CFE24_14280 [Flavobacterium sp. BFFFF2]
MQVGTATDWKAIVGGGGHVIAMKTNNSLWGWGAWSHGQNGNGGVNNFYWIPKQIGADTNCKSIAAGYTTSYAIKNNGSLWGFGQNDKGQMATATGQDVLVPTQIGTDTDWESVQAGEDFAVALKTNGTVYLWGGENANGQLANGIVGTLGGPTYPNVTALTLPGCSMGTEDFATSLWSVINPVHEHLQFNYVPLTNAQTEIFDPLGRSMGTYSMLPSGGSIDIPAQTWPNGLYMLVLKQNGKVVQMQKVVKE